MAETELTHLETGEIRKVSPVPEPTTGQGFLKPLPETTLTERVAGGVAASAVITSLVAMIVEQGALVIVAGILSILLGPYCYLQQTRLTDIKALSETKVALQAQVDLYTQENKKLVTNIDTLTISVDRLTEIQAALQVLNESETSSISQLEQQVQANKGILNSLKGNYKANILQNLLSVILRSDGDQNEQMDAHELDDLIRRIQNISGVKVHEERFREHCQGSSIAVVLDICKNLLQPNVPEAERIFEIPE